MRAYYWTNQLRGCYCAVEHYTRAGGAEYFFAYLDDYPDNHLVFDDHGHVTKRSDRYAFTNVFVYSPDDGSVEMFAKGGRRVHEPLYSAFCEAVLGVQADPGGPLKPVYHLDHLLDPNCPLPTDPADRIAEVRIVRMRLEFRDLPSRYIELKADPKDHVNDIYQMITQYLNGGLLPLSRLRVRQATFRVVFMQDSRGKAKTLTFNVSCPNSCDLKSKPDEMRAIGEWCLRRGEITHD